MQANPQTKDPATSRTRHGIIHTTPSHICGNLREPSETIKPNSPFVREKCSKKHDELAGDIRLTYASYAAWKCNKAVLKFCYEGLGGCLAKVYNCLRTVMLGFVFFMSFVVQSGMEKIYRYVRGVHSHALAYFEVFVSTCPTIFTSIWIFWFCSRPVPILWSRNPALKNNVGRF